MRINAERLNASLATMWEIGATPGGGVTRLALSDEDRQARGLLWRWLEDAGMTVRIDDFGTMIGRREGRENLPPVLLGSHLDSVTMGGRYDGVLGVMSALEVIRTLNDHDVVTRHPIEIVNWTNEEGARFQPALLGSGAVTGRFDKECVYSRVERDGLRFDDELRRIGYMGDAENRPVDGSTYLELHIEQGPQLEEEGLAVGVVDGIIGDTWMSVEIRGQADHAGPTPMHTRHDALLVAAGLIQGVNRIAIEAGDPAVGTVGRLDVQPNVINTVPGAVSMSVDLRSPESDRMSSMVDRVRSLAESIADEQGVEIELDRYWTMEPTPFAPTVTDAVVAACRELEQPEHHLWSGAGHDAKYAVDLWPSAMIFVRSRDGVSHSESEYTAPEDIALGGNVLLLSTMRLAAR